MYEAKNESKFLDSTKLQQQLAEQFYQSNKKAPDSESSDLAQAFTAMLERLCTLTQIPPANHADVLANKGFLLANVPVFFQLEEWSRFVKAYIDVGEPLPSAAHEMYVYFLEQQLHMPAPFQILLGLHPESRRIILYACSPLPMNAEDDQNFLNLLQACLIIVDHLKADCAEKSLQMNQNEFDSAPA
ncbi:MAG: hypothetical protein V4623_09390 [Pseudomonadota bacterium]